MEKVAVLGLDIGLKRIGVSGCDGLGIVATGLTTVHRTSFKNDVELFRELVNQRDINLLVVGVPYNREGEIGFQAKQVMKYARRLGDALEIAIEFTDERFTSVEAEEQLRNSKKFSPRNKGLIDKRAATIILQQWLDERSH